MLEHVFQELWKNKQPKKKKSEVPFESRGWSQVVVAYAFKFQQLEGGSLSSAHKLAHKS